VNELDLDQDLADRPIIAMISRLAAQKGCDLLVDVIEDVLRLDVGLVILGAGEERYQALLVEFGEKYPGSIAVKIGFDEPLAHRIMAGADMLLLPSRYEPCGLTQMYALKYGTVPVVRATGGLDDTIVPFNPETGEGNGFKFSPYESVVFLGVIRQAVDLFLNSQAWKRLIVNGMKADFSWEESARKYILLYEKVRKGRQK